MKYYPGKNKIRIPSLNNHYCISWKNSGTPKFCGPCLISGFVWAIWPFEIYGNPALVSVWSTPSARAVDRCLEEKNSLPRWQSLQCGPKKRQSIVIFGRVKFNSTQNGWNNPSYKFLAIQIYVRPFLGGCTTHMVETKQQVHPWNFPTLLPQSLGNVTIFQSRMTFQGTWKLAVSFRKIQENCNTPQANYERNPFIDCW